MVYVRLLNAGQDHIPLMTCRDLDPDDRILHPVNSAILAFSRSFVFMLITMLVLPAILGVNGIWLATPAAELMALALSVFMFARYRKKYQY